MYPVIKHTPRKKYKGFTLVELIVVITILVILGTISFVQLQGYAGSARDSVRTSDLANLSKGLDIYQIKVGSYPVPTGAVSYTGGVSGGSLIQQGGVNGSLLGFSVATPTDPLTKTGYIYSILGNGTYYQIGSELENPLSRVINPLIDQVYADGPKTAFLRGNYTMDPSLPSLIVIPGSVPMTTGSGGVFSPEVCFVTNGSSTNTVSGGTGSCIAKKNMALKTLDSSLVGYWDMETLTGTMLKDLSGNGNDGVFSGAVLPTSTGAINGAESFNGTNGTITIPYSNKISFDYNQDFSLASWIKIPAIQVDTSNSWNYDTLVEKGSFATPYSYSLIVRNQNHSTEAGKILALRWDGTYNPFILSSIAINDNKFHYIIFKKSGATLSLYIDGKFDGKTIDTTTSSMIQNTPLILGAGNFSTTHFNGSLDDVKIYSRALGDSEIKQQARAAGF